MSVVTFRIEKDVKARLDAVVEQLGLNQSKILRDAVIERLEELEEMALIMERIRANRPKRPINELWKALELED
jgi:RHH-type transcriptional regulator, rel operon repressor / antitoxin RelB